MPLATHTGILSCLQSTVPFGTASARKHCSSTTHRCDPYTLGQLIRFWESTRLRRDDVLALNCQVYGSQRQIRCFGVRFEPRTSSAHNHSTSELLRTL